MLGAVTAVALALTAGIALAEEATGTIQNIDMTTKTLTVGDKVFQWSPENSMGVKLEELKPGDEVKVMYEAQQNGHNSVMEIMKPQ